jgi:hypothetical protein
VLRAPPSSAITNPSIVTLFLFLRQMLALERMFPMQAWRIVGYEMLAKKIFREASLSFGRSVCERNSLLGKGVCCLARRSTRSRSNGFKRRDGRLLSDANN